MKWQNIAYNKITKTSAILILLFFFSIPFNAFALGIGGIKLSSTLDQPLDANIELLGVSTDELSEIEIKLASNAIYERMGIERGALIDQLVFSIREQDDGKHVINIATKRSVTEPFLNFLIEVNWRNGRLLREFTVLLDPPVFLDEEATPVSAPEAELPSSFSVTTQAEEEPELAPMVEAPNIDEAGEAGSSEVAQSESVSASGSSLSETAQSSAMTHTVQRGEHLWKIAKKMRPQNISVEQMMLALQRVNPQAFFGDTVSQLKAGAVLRIDENASLDGIGVADAIAEIARQSQEWLAAKRERQARNAVAAESVADISNESFSDEFGAEQSVASAPQEDTSLLKLVSPLNEQSESTDAAQTNATMEAGEAQLENLNVELAMASEDVEAKQRENEDLRNRFTSLQEQMSKAKNLIELKDNELNQFDTGVEDEALSEIMPTVELGVESETITENMTPSSLDSSEPEQKETEPNLWEDPVTIGTAAGVILLILLIIVVVRRKRKAGVAGHNEAVDYEDTSLEDLFAEPAKDRDETQIIKFNDSFVDKDHSGSMPTEPLTELNFETSENELLESKEPLLDPVAEADVYLTYEKYDKAEVLLNEAIQAEPSRQELKVKLLEVFALSQSVNAFNDAADVLYASISGDDQHPAWQKAVVLAQDVGSESPLFANNQDDITALLDEAEIDADVSFGDKDVVTLSDDVPLFEELDLDKTFDGVVDPLSSVDDKTEKFVGSDSLDDLSTNLDTSEVSEASLAELDALNIDSIDVVSDVLEFTDIDELAIKNEPEVTKILSELEEIKAFEPEGELAADLIPDLTDEPKLVKDKPGLAEDAAESKFELTENVVATTIEEVSPENLEFPGDEKSITVDDVFDPAASSSAGATDGNNFSETSLFLLSDEVGTKLDLAKAYMEMGDYDGAKDLLSEVLGEGNSKQQEEAKELLEAT